MESKDYFSRVPLSAILDPGLSKNALCVLVALNSFKPGYQPSLAQISQRSRIKDKDFRATKRAIRELHAAGYCHWQPPKTNGQRPTIIRFQQHRLPQLSVRTSPAIPAPVSPAISAPVCPAPIIKGVVLDPREADRADSPQAVQYLQNHTQQDRVARILGFLGEKVFGAVQSFLECDYWRRRGLPLDAFERHLDEFRELAAQKEREKIRRERLQAATEECHQLITDQPVDPEAQRRWDEMKRGIFRPAPAGGAA